MKGIFHGTVHSHKRFGRNSIYFYTPEFFHHFMIATGRPVYFIGMLAGMAIHRFAFLFLKGCDINIGIRPESCCL